MRSRQCKIGIVLGIVILFLGASVVPSISGNNVFVSNGIIESSLIDCSSNIENGLKSISNSDNNELRNRMNNLFSSKDEKMETILHTSFEEEWVLDSDGNYYAPPRLGR